MDHFNYKQGELFAENVALTDIAEQFGTPAYVYSRATLEQHYKAFDTAFGDYPHRICYSVKANSNLAVLNVLARLGAHFDVVSGGELERVIRAGGDTSGVVFSGVGKADWEIERALSVEIFSFNVESPSELNRIAQIAERMGRIAPIAVRINPNVDAKTHPYISTGLKHNKFGVSIQEAIDLYTLCEQHSHLKSVGVACHIGSQLTDTKPFEDALDKVIEFVQQLQKQGINIDHIDFGGGLGVRYKDETPPTPAEYWAALKARLDANNMHLPISIEPGRAIAGNAGLLLTKVQYLKQGEISQFCIVDAAMNDLIRPALYSAYQDIVAVSLNTNADKKVYDIVGPVCESADFLGKERALAVNEGNYLAVRTAGAYGATLASNYNTRTRAAEIMVDGAQTHLIRKREELADLMRHESLLPD